MTIDTTIALSQLFFPHQMFPVAVEAIAIISATNNPLLLKDYTSTQLSNSQGLKYNFIANTMLDVIEERVVGRLVCRSTDRRNLIWVYLQLLRIWQWLDVNLILGTRRRLMKFGYVTNSNVKFLLFVTVQDKIVKDGAVKAVFKQLHDLYQRFRHLLISRLTMNVFYDPTTTALIQDKTFLKGLEKLAS